MLIRRGVCAFMLLMVVFLSWGGAVWVTGQLSFSPVVSCLLGEHRVAVSDGAGPPNGQAADGLWEEIGEAPTQCKRCTAVRMTVEPVERARAIHRTAARTGSAFIARAQRVPTSGALAKGGGARRYTRL